MKYNEVVMIKYLLLTLFWVEYYF